MFDCLFAEGGLSLDRLRAFMEVGAAGSIAKATAGDVVRQSQYSRQIKELEDFFRIKLIERHGKGIRLTPNGKELARISRFFLFGLWTFQRGCLAQDQVCRIGGGATALEHVVLPAISKSAQQRLHYTIEVVEGDDMERALHELRLEFAVTTRLSLTRPLELKELMSWRIGVWIPKALGLDKRAARRALKDGTMPLAIAQSELSLEDLELFGKARQRLVCQNFLQAMRTTHEGRWAAVLPEFLGKTLPAEDFTALQLPALRCKTFYLAWNPRLMRLNPHLAHTRDFLINSLRA